MLLAMPGVIVGAFQVFDAAYDFEPLTMTGEMLATPLKARITPPE